MSFFDFLMSKKEVIVAPRTLATASHKGEFLGVFGPGCYKLDNENDSLMVTTHYLEDPSLSDSVWKLLTEQLPDSWQNHILCVEGQANKAAIIERQGRLQAIVMPKERTLLWQAAGPWDVEWLEIAPSRKLSDKQIARLDLKMEIPGIAIFRIKEDAQGLLEIDGLPLEVLHPGLHIYWDDFGQHHLTTVNTNIRTLEVSGQELLTKDKVTIRINASAEYRVTDVKTAILNVTDYKDSLYKSLQLGFRKALATRTMDEILADKVMISSEALEDAKKVAKKLGLEINQVDLVDVILPGEMRDLLNRVVAAQKEAEANIIRRREETNATRSLLNTAKVMAENPIMLRLKELDTLESISHKINNINVSNGTHGLLNDLIKIQPDDNA